MLLAETIVAAAPRDIWDRLIDAGPWAAIGFAVAYLIYKFGGRLIEGHLKFLSTAQQSNVTNAQVNQSLEKNVGAITQSLTQKMDPKGDPKFDDHNFSTVHTNKALEYLARAMEELSTGHPKEVQAMPLIQRAIQTLRKTARDHDSDTFPSTKIVK